jgi:hypothetical protein
VNYRPKVVLEHPAVRAYWAPVHRSQAVEQAPALAWEPDKPVEPRVEAEVGC